MLVLKLMKYLRRLIHFSVIQRMQNVFKQLNVSQSQKRFVSLPMRSLTRSSVLMELFQIVMKNLFKNATLQTIAKMFQSKFVKKFPLDLVPKFPGSSRWRSARTESSKVAPLSRSVDFPLAANNKMEAASNSLDTSNSTRV